MGDTNRKDSATILIVDDDPIILDVLEELIPIYGYKPVIASSARTALDKAHELEKVDLLITDVIMPGMNGVDLAKQFSSLYPETRVLFMSAYSNTQMIHQIKSHAEYSFIYKPFGTDAMINEIQSLLEEPSVPPQDKTNS
jgi:DNA-binding NtrC family response regulator